MLQPRVVEKPGFTAVGFEAAFIHALSPDTTNFKVIGPLWDKFFRFVWRIRGSFLALSWATAGGNAGGDSIIVLKWNVLWRSTKYRWPLL